MTGATPRRAYFVLNGVRRALASLAEGRKTVPAILYREGCPPRPFRASLSSLHVPASKSFVPLDHRLLQIVPPIDLPIEIERLGLRGQPRAVPLSSVEVR